MTHIESRLKNINIDGVENCNLLCKLIIDYEATSNCIIKKGKYKSVSGEQTTTEYTYLEYPEGSFINYRDTSYEVTRIVFFQPSRHTIDNERFDFEVNIYHGTFEDETDPNNRKGIVSHAHYKSDDKNHNTYNKDYHYHTNSSSENIHDSDYLNINQNNIVSCILFNISDHQGTNSNVFFNQFINNFDFKNDKISGSNPLKINTHSTWSLNDLLPKRRSFFMYEDETKKNTYLVFDSINSIDKGIVDILKHHIYEKIIGDNDIPMDGNHNILYKNNIEVITDEKYKKHMREQIKLLLGIHRTSMRLNKPSGTSKDYNDESSKLYQKTTGSGLYRDFQYEEEQAKNLIKEWHEWGKGKLVERDIKELTLDVIPTTKEELILFNQKYINYQFSPKYKYREMFEETYQEDIKRIFFSDITLEAYENMDIFREVLYKYNLKIKHVKAYKLEGTKEIASRYLGIIDTRIQFSIQDLFSHLNFLDVKQAGKIKIVGYENNFNIYTENIDNNNLIELEDPDITKIDNYFYVPNVPENLNVKGSTKSSAQSATEPRDNLHFTKDVVIVEYEIEFFTNNIINGIKSVPNLSDILPTNQDFIAKEQEATAIQKQITEIYRLLIHTDNTLPYTSADDNIFKEQIIGDSSGGNELDETFKKMLIPGVSNYHLKIDSKDFKFYSIKPPIGIYNYFILKSFQDYLSDKNIKYFDTGIEFNTTINGDVCQNWNSHQVHHEGGLMDSFRKVPTFPVEGKTYENMNEYEKAGIRDGLYQISGSGDNTKFLTHNKCRNPGNSRAAPWCYTKNPTKRWDYCVVPDHTHKFAKIVLIITTILFIALAYVTVKVIFRHNYFTKFMAMMVGAKVSEGVASSNAK